METRPPHETIAGAATELPRPPHVAILLATRNGACWLDEQISSIAAQDIDGRIDVLCSDDYSRDETRALLAVWQRRWARGTFTVADGPGSGFADNFRSLVLDARTDASHVAFCDQDDIWLSGKLGAAIATIGADERPALYGSRMTFVNATGNVMALSPVFTRAPSFENALAQNIIAGNTAVFNRAAFATLQAAAERTRYAFHDWFSYLIISGAGGVVHYSPRSDLLYRQHGSNAVGGSVNLMHKASRVGRALRGTYRRYVEQNIAALRACEDLLAKPSIATLELFEAARHGPPGKRLKMLKASGVHRQTTAETLMLYAACAMGRL